MGIFERSSLNPILTPSGSGWWKVYNPGVAIDSEGQVHLFPRVMAKESDWDSRIAHAVSHDGETFKWLSDLALVRQREVEQRGLEDPRITLIGDTYHMMFAAYNGRDVVLESAVTDDLFGRWQRCGRAVPKFRFAAHGGRRVRWRNGRLREVRETIPGRQWSKSGAIFRMADGRYGLLFGEYQIWFGTSLNGRQFNVARRPLLEARKGTSFFDNMFVEMGPPPIETEKGWIVLYHGIDDAFRYQLGVLVLDRYDPTRIVYRSKNPVFVPREGYEVGDNLIDVIPGGIQTAKEFGAVETKRFYERVRSTSVMPHVNAGEILQRQAGVKVQH